MEIRDNRDKEWFWLDNEYLNGYAKYLGATASLVYISLCRHVDNKTQTAFPSMELIAKELGMQRASISRAIKSLADWKIIEIKEGYDKKTKRRKNNVYTLTKKTEWVKKPCNNKLHGNNESHVTIKTEPCNNNDESHVTQSYSNNTHINNTHITIDETSSSGIPLVIKAFENINPATKRFYGAKPQREACKNLIEAYGLERVLSVIENAIPKTNKIQYFPSITTPLQLWEKWATLESKVNQYQAEKLLRESKSKITIY